MTPGDIGDFCDAVAEFGAAVAAMVETQAMIAENDDRKSHGLSVAYTEGAFMAVFDKYRLQIHRSPGAL